MDHDDVRFVEELRVEFRQALSMVQTRLSVSEPEKTFSPSNIIGAMNLLALEYCLEHGVPPQNFIAAMKAAGSQLELEMTTRTGLFAPPRL
jgi:hypothetical protein